MRTRNKEIVCKQLPEILSMLHKVNTTPGYLLENTTTFCIYFWKIIAKNNSLFLMTLMTHAASINTDESCIVYNVNFIIRQPTLDFHLLIDDA